MTHKVFKLTADRFKELEHELNYLKTVREKEVTELIKVARSYGDLSENSEYDEAKNEQGRLYSRIAEIENILTNSELIDEDAIQTETVTAGCHVTLADKKNGESAVYQVVGSQEANPMQRRISDESPLGRALIGAHVGESVEYEAPMGRMEFTVTAISK